MKLARTLEKVTMHPWLITPGGYAAVMQLIDSKLGESASVWMQAPEPKEKKDSFETNSNIAQITVSGVLGQRLSWLENMCGGCDYLDISSAIDSALINDQVKGILFVFDSPGGMATGCPECAAKIASIPIPKVGFTDSLMTSGAYYLASGLDYLVATPSASIGSIGVIIPWVDKTKMWDKMGLQFDPIYSQGDDLKPAMYGPSLTEVQREHLQQHVNDTAAAFQDHVSHYRALDFSKLKAGAFKGQRALGHNLIDRIGLLEDAHNELVKRIQKTKTA